MDTVANVVVETGKCLWNSLAEPISYVCNPTKNLEPLEREVTRLMNKSADIERQVEVEEVAQLSQRTNKVDGWLKEAQDLKLKCERVLEEGKSHQQNRCLVWCCPTYCRLNYKLGKKVSQLCKDVRDLDAKEFAIVVTPLPLPPVPEMPMEKTVGLDSMLSHVWNQLQEEHVGIIGLYGMGGVGKTTLLKQINEKFHPMSSEIKILWIVVSKQVNLDNIREDIRKELGIKDTEWRDQSAVARAAQICRVLNRIKFVLLVDDLWEPLDLAKIGIPFPSRENGSKIVFTTRSEEVCGKMKANKRVHIQCLSQQDALQLFKENVGDETLALHREIPNYAIEIANECKGLPLALITIGRAMASMKTLDEWASALRVLRSYPSEFSELVDDVYKLLLFSYDILNSTHQQCFLYGALFPEDSNIKKNHLIDLWIAEGFLGETNNIYDARDRGELILRRLKSACLLESGRNEKEIKMHDVLRDMALWLARDQGQNDNKVIVEVYDEKIAKNISRWQEAERISLIGPGEEVILTEPPVCPHLLTLLSHDHNNLEISEQFFMSSPALRVFECNRSVNHYLSNVGVRLEKFSIGTGGPINLRYLNLSDTNIEELPVEITKLTSLLYLLLERTNKLRISKEVISCLLSLKVLRKTHWVVATKTEGFIEGVECLKQLDELSLTIHDALSVRKLLEAPNLRRSIRWLEISFCDDVASIDAYISRRLELTNLHKVVIFKSNPVNLSWLIYAPNLQDLWVIDCSTLEVIFDEDILQTVDEDASARLFSSLRELYLYDLPNLRSIHKGTLSSPALRTIEISDCPDLKKLPFDFNSAKSSFTEVRAARKWWSALEWDDEAAKAFFTEKFVELKVPIGTP